MCSLTSKMEEFNPTFFDTYDPLKAGSIDGTDEVPHDKAILRAMSAKYKPNKYLSGDPECTVFLSRLSPNTSEQTVQKAFCEFGDVVNVTIMRDIVTGFSKCYGFVEMRDCYQARVAVRSGHKMIIDDHEILVDSEKGHVLKGWIPRRLGGGLGGKRESGQLRFGGRDRPFSRPILYSGFNTKKEEVKIDKHHSKQRHSETKQRSNSRRNRSRERHKSRSRSRERHKSRSRSRSRSRSYSSSRYKKQSKRQR